MYEILLFRMKVCGIPLAESKGCETILRGMKVFWKKFKVFENVWVANKGSENSKHF